MEHDISLICENVAPLMSCKIIFKISDMEIYSVGIILSLTSPTISNTYGSQWVTLQ